MPQGGRKVPFSGKQKRVQLRDRRDRKDREDSCSRTDGGSEGQGSRNASRNRCRVTRADQGSAVLTSDAIAKINSQPDRHGSSRDANRYALTFLRENEAELEQRKKEAREPFARVPPEGLEVKTADVFPRDELGMPKRPPWDFNMAPVKLEMREQKYFHDYLESIENEFGSLANLSHFELNLETWRQLWRVIEMADVILLVVDIRHPIFHFPPALYHHVTKELGKDFIIVLNKADLIPANLVVAWINHFKEKYPEIHVTPFASYAGMKMKQDGRKKGRRIGKLRMASEGAKRLFKICQEIVKDKVNITNWHEKIEKELKEEDVDDDEDTQHNPLTTGEAVVEKRDLSYYKSEKFKDGILTIGCVGHPNVGKSSVLNAIMGRKVVSVSRTPGHTKYFQTIFITPTVKLCDCPGLVFPSKIPKAMQVLMGCFPIAQLREPYSAIMYMAQRLDVVAILKLQHPEGSETWSANDICEAWAIKRGLLTAKAARPDVYRAANHILRMALDGRTICLCFYPEDYVRNKAQFVSHPDVAKIEVLQCQRNSEALDEEALDSFDSDDEFAKSSQAVSRPKPAAAGASEEADEEDEDGNDDEEEETNAPVQNRYAFLTEDD
ncbi:Guanine nucleotide-binding protein-like 1 [Halotydeus destructor]|nr:Guanine nucleotide-binding protein-like 1 [Halotydeus destructor]